MRILMVNKFLYPNGGSETYMFKLGQWMTKIGHEVQYFGMEHERRCVGNRVDAYTANMDFHHGSKLDKLTYPIRTIYSSEARQKLRLVLEDFEPDVVHLNNFNFQLTPSIILEADKWRRETGHSCRILYTAHDSQLVCPSHMMYLVGSNKLCNRCQGKYFSECIRHKCIHGSALRSLLGALEGRFWKLQHVYRKLDHIVCCSEFMKRTLDQYPDLREKTVTLHNFITLPAEREVTQKREYVLYVGRLAVGKGVETLLEVCRELPYIPFVFAGRGPLEEQLRWPDNVMWAGYLSGDRLDRAIREARFSVYPAEAYENCPFSVMESIMHGTPVIGSNLGGIPELIRPGVDGDLFEGGSKQELKACILALWQDRDRLARYTAACASAEFDTVETYTEKLLKLYRS